MPKKVKVYKKKKKVPETQIIEQLQARYKDIDSTTINKFTDFPLSQKTLDGLKENNFLVPTDIQKQSIGIALQGRDVVGAAKTGSGKTLAFLIPLLETLYCKQWTNKDGLGALIITPVRELALQIFETLCKIGHHHRLSASLIIGGKDLHIEKKCMDKFNIIVGTPGRLIHHMGENPLLDCNNIQVLILDEADRMLDMGFRKDMDAIIDYMPQDRLTLLFSATQTKSVKDLARLALKNPLYVSVHEHATHSTPDALQQRYIFCNLSDKLSFLWSFLRNHLKHKIIVFFSSCKQVKYVYEAFCRLKPGTRLSALYGSMHQVRRMKVYKSFSSKESTAVLFATDIAARGLDFPVVDWVVQMDCPEDVNTYIHRAGRSARLENGGESLLVLLRSEEAMVKKLTDKRIPISEIKIHPDKLMSPQKKLEANLVSNIELKESANRAFLSYIKAVYLMKDKDIFDVKALDYDGFARSLGLAVTPRIRFLQRKEAAAKQQQFDCNDDSDEEFLTVKRTNIKIEDDLPLENQVNNEKVKKVITKAAVAKKILKKKIVANTKINFDEEGKEIVDSAKSKMSEMARQYEQTNESGINIEDSRKILQAEDKFDKQRFIEKVKQKHREEKRKLKAKKKGIDEENEDEDDEHDEDDEDNNEDYEDYDSDESGDGPDLSWLPDPDKIYGKKKKGKDDESDQDDDDDQSESDEGDEDDDQNESEEESEEEEIHKPKRKLDVQDKHNAKRKKFVSEFNDLETDENIAMQLLQFN